MRTAGSLIAAVAVTTTAAMAPAETLLLEIGTRITSEQIDIPEQFADLNATFDSIPEHGDFTQRIIVPEFEKYAKGKHVVQFNVGNGLNYGPTADAPPKIKTPGLAVTLETKIFGALEGVSTRVRVKDAPRPIGSIILPDETQLADYGSLTIVDGVVTDFTYGWTEPDNPGLASMNRFLVERRKFPVGMASLTIDVKAFSAPVKIGDLVLVYGMKPEVRIAMDAAQPE